jgi:microcystin-dependent protein
MADPFMGEIRLFAGTYAPQGWLPCDGRSLPISDNEILYSIIGETYGSAGAGQFNIPNMIERLPIGAGQGTGLSNYTIAETGGAVTVTLTQAEVPSHGHSFNVSNQDATAITPGETVTFGNPPSQTSFYIDTAQPTKAILDFSSNAVSSFGSSEQHPNTMPTLTIFYIICVDGLYPTPPS